MRKLALILLAFASPGAALAASPPSPVFQAVTIGGGSIGGVAATADAQAGTSTSLVMTPATTRAATTSQLTALPTTMPSTVGALWNNGGLISVVQP